MIDYLQPPLGYLLRLPCGDDAADSPLDEPARDRAEQAAAFLRYERIGRTFAPDSTAARAAAEIVWLGCSPTLMDSFYSGGLEEFLSFLMDEDRGLPCVLVASNAELHAALQRLGISLPPKESLAGDPTGANVCELVAPGGIISLHRATIFDEMEGRETTAILPRARHMILDFSFTDLERTVAWKETSPA